MNPREVGYDPVRSSSHFPVKSLDCELEKPAKAGYAPLKMIRSIKNF